MSGELPPGWCLATLSSLFDRFQYGVTAKADAAAEGLRFLRITDIKDGVISWETVPGVVAGTDGVDRYRLADGDFVFARSGSIEKTARIRTPPEAVFASYLIRARPKHSDHADWLEWFLRSRLYLEQVAEAAAGIGMVNINAEKISRFVVPLPPLVEQRRIVARIEALFVRTRRARADLERIAPLAQKSRIAVLASAFRGDLTRDLRHGSDLGEADGPWPIPTSWAWRRVDDVGHVGLGRQRSPVNHNGPFMRPYMRAANITWGGWDFSDVKEMNFAEPDFSRFRLERGDVLLNEGSGSAREVGKPAIWRGEIPNCCFQNTLLRVQPRQCTTDYLYFYFLDAALSGRFAAETQGVNIHHIGKEGLASLPIPVPPSHEQVAVAQRLKAVLNRPAQAEREATRALALLDRLEQSFLTRAFRGELVPQDPNDEPASILLERIKAGGEAEDEKLTRKRRQQPNRSKENSMKDKPVPARDQLLKDSEKWPKTGLPFEAIAKRNFMPHDTLRDALFELLSGPSPALQQRFDSEAEAMVIQRVAA